MRSGKTPHRMHGEYVISNSSLTTEFNNKLSQMNTVLSGIDFRVARKISKIQVQPYL